ncbi:MAG: hypothetical protein LC725_08095 [Lentisphaerae bacterium]|nr:hypothetical protein [Lentisphaerota bacterium]
MRIEIKWLTITAEQLRADATEAARVAAKAEATAIRAHDRIDVLQGSIQKARAAAVESLTE